MFICGSLFLFNSPTAAATQSSNCASDHYDQQAELVEIIDGDTLRIHPRQSIRLIAINTPELHPRNQANPEPFAQAAKNAITEYLKPGDKIWLRYGQQRQDRYQRQLAHVFLADGRNLQALILERGLAAHITIPPNLWMKDCYRKLETNARQNKLGIWSLPRYASVELSQLDPRQSGYFHIKGRVQAIHRSKHKTRITLGKSFTLLIDKRDDMYFKGYDFDQLNDQMIEARGWIYINKYGQNMRVRHPDALRTIK